jgi:ribosome-associated protein
MTLDYLELAHLIVDLISDVKGENILLLDIHEITTIADYFVICSAGTDRQLRAIVEKITTEVKQQRQIQPSHVEGQPEGGWVLIDYHSIVIHVFSPEQRAYYDLEGFWREGKTLVRIQ